MGDSRYERALALAGLVVEQVAIDSSTVGLCAEFDGRGEVPALRVSFPKYA